MKVKVLKIFVVMLILLGGCSLFQKDSFDGVWHFEFSGDVADSFDVTINPDLTFEFTRNVNSDMGEVSVIFSGKVNQEGNLDADIFVSGSKIGRMNGTINYETGEGKWYGSSYSGSWRAVKR